MTFLSTQELKENFQKDILDDTDVYAKLVSKYLAAAIKRHNVNIDNVLTVGLCPDYRVSSIRIFTAEDTTSPILELDYGLLRNSEYSVPANIVSNVEAAADAKVLGLTELGFHVEPFWGYVRNFGIIGDFGLIEETFRPVKCYRIRWSNAD